MSTLVCCVLEDICTNKHKISDRESYMHLGYGSGVKTLLVLDYTGNPHKSELNVLIHTSLYCKENEFISAAT